MPFVTVTVASWRINSDMILFGVFIWINEDPSSKECFRINHDFVKEDFPLRRML